MNAAKRTAKLYQMGKESGNWPPTLIPHRISGRAIRYFFRKFCGVIPTHKKGWNK